MRKKASRKIAVIAALILTLSCVMVPAAVFGEETAATATITIKANPEAKGEPIVFEDIVVSSDAAEKAGYVDGITPENGVTILDAFVEFHKKQYPDKEVKDVLTVGDGSETTGWGTNLGSIYKIFNIETDIVGYNLNGSATDVCTNVAIDNGDFLDVFIYGSENYADVYLFFSPDKYAVNEGEPVELILNEAGYDDQWNPITMPHVNRTVVLTSSDGKAIESSEKTDAEGKVVFEDLEAGEYIASVKAEGDDDYFVMPWAKVTVTAKPTTPTEDIPDNEITGETEETGSTDVTTETTAAVKPENSPKTGDDFNAVPLIVIALCAAAVGGVTLIRRRPADK